MAAGVWWTGRAACSMGWEPGYRRNRITYEAGYVEDGAPRSILGMALQLVTMKYLPSELRSLPVNLESARVRGAELEFLGLEDP